MRLSRDGLNLTQIAHKVVTVLQLPEHQMALITSGSAAQVEGGLAQLKYNKDGKKGWWPLAAVVPIEETLSRAAAAVGLSGDAQKAEL